MAADVWVYFDCRGEADAVFDMASTTENERKEFLNWLNGEPVDGTPFRMEPYAPASERDRYRAALEEIAWRGCEKGGPDPCHVCSPCIARRALEPEETEVDL